MHEMSIALQLIDQLGALAREHRLASVTTVTVEVGAMQQVVPEALRTAFMAARPESVAEHAELKITEQTIEAVCRECGRSYQPELACYACPHCGRADPEITAGGAITIVSLQGETSE